MSQDGSLQFEQAEFENPATQSQCAECQQALAGSYFDVNGLTTCEACRYAIESRLNLGSGAGRFVRAAGAGLVAAIGGALLYYAIAALTGYEFGLIAIVVGFAVGTAVRWGSHGRGGWKYQGLAMVLTYLAIVSTYIPSIVEGFREANATEVSAGTASPGQPAAAVVATGSAGPPATGEAGAPAAAPVLAIIVLLVIASIAPFLLGFENIMGLIIIAIGLYEAWKLNRRAELTITGPHALAPTPTAPAAATGA